MPQYFWYLDLAQLISVSVKSPKVYTVNTKGKRDKFWGIRRILFTDCHLLSLRFVVC